jgi:dTDP-4-dehydrorhamnose 3,5-epimerase-like enzyme
MPTDVTIVHLSESTDERGLSFSLTTESIGELIIKDVHIAAVRPGCVRGNHYHSKKLELITVVYKDEWSLHWDTGPETVVQCRSFSGCGAVTIQIPLFWSHAVKNNGRSELWLFNAADMSFDRSVVGADQDAHTRRVI